MTLFCKPLDFTPFFNRVVSWNATARNGEHDFSTKAKDFQLSLVLEEYEGEDELLDGYNTLNKAMVLDALCDVFVTASYLYYQQAEGKVDSVIIPVPDTNFDYVFSLSNSIKGTYSGKDAVMNACALLYMFDGNSTKGLIEVLNSNDSKFPEVVNKDGVKLFYDRHGYEVDPDVECRQIEARNAGRYTGVSYIIVQDNGVERFIFKSDKGKIVKPSSFFEPDLEKYC